MAQMQISLNIEEMLVYSVCFKMEPGLRFLYTILLLSGKSSTAIKSESSSVFFVLVRIKKGPGMDTSQNTGIFRVKMKGY